jgi:hypothetical protein
VKLSRLTSTLLIAFGGWTWIIWPRFALAVWQDDRAWQHGSPTAFLWVHVLLIAASVLFGTAIAVLGVRGWLAFRAAARAGANEKAGKIHTH